MHNTETSPHTFSATFSLITHRLPNLIQICHCPRCGTVYHSGKYTLQSEELVVCYRETVTCEHCGETGLVFPMMFRDTNHVIEFYSLFKDGKAAEVALAPLSIIELAFIDEKFFAAQKIH